MTVFGGIQMRQTYPGKGLDHGNGFQVLQYCIFTVTVVPAPVEFLIVEILQLSSSSSVDMLDCREKQQMLTVGCLQDYSFN